MAKAPVRKKTAMDEWAIAAGSTLGRLVAKIDRLTARRSEISAEIQHYVNQAEGALKKAVSQEAVPQAPRAVRKQVTRKKTAARKTAAKKASKTRKRA